MTVDRLQPPAQVEDEDFYLMANLFPKHTGLPFVVWISERGGARHDIRVKVASGPKAIPPMISVGIRPDVHVIEGKMNASDLALLRTWIEANRQTLIDYWEGQIDTVDAMARLRKI
jgi:hypothetical protein